MSRDELADELGGLRLEWEWAVTGGGVVLAWCSIAATEILAGHGLRIRWGSLAPPAGPAVTVVRFLRDFGTDMSWISAGLSRLAVVWLVKCGEAGKGAVYLEGGG